MTKNAVKQAKPRYTCLGKKRCDIMHSSLEQAVKCSAKNDLRIVGVHCGSHVELTDAECDQVIAICDVVSITTSNQR